MTDINAFLPYPAPAKVNLFLHVTGRRADGYHLLQSVFRLIDLQDTVHIRVRDDGVIRRSQALAGVPEDSDLCIRAARLLQQHAGSALGAELYVDKCIPMGGGLGGGSSDAATVLMVLNALWQLQLPQAELMQLGLKLGADVPFFIGGHNAWVEGIGERIQPIELEPACYLVLTPQIEVSTAQVFNAEELTRDSIPTTIAAFSRVLPGNGQQQDLFRNDLEAVVRQRYPAVAACLDWLNQFTLARMSGSGASVFAEFGQMQDAQRILQQVPPQIAGSPVFAYVARGLQRHPLYNPLN